jgi:histidine triad (HIT) family protein
MNDCVFCTSPDIKAHTIFRNDLAWAFPTNIPITPGHTLICPVRHVEKMADCTPQEKTALLDLAEKIKAALKVVYGSEGFNHAWNEGEIAGQAVPHLHLHIVPRKEGDMGITEYEPRKFLYRPGSREATPEDELRAVARQIKDAL